jgi:nicotinate-nucleotide--dimethylbenzimidazole phosphoribosyltransferase
MRAFTDLAQLTTLNEIRRLLSDLPERDPAAEQAARARQAELTKPPGALGRLEEIAVWFAAWQGQAQPQLEHPRVAIFAGNHGVASHHISAYPSEVTAQMVQNFIAGGAAINQLTGLLDADLRVYELDLESQTEDFSQAPAMQPADTAKTLAYGMMAVEEGIDLLCLGEMGIGNSSSAAALAFALFGGKVEDWVGRGTGIGDAQLAHKTDLVAQGVARHGGKGDGLDLLAALGGRELAAMAGAIIAARMARVPVLLDGYASTAAAACLYAVNPAALDHCLVGHLSAEPGHQRLCSALGKVPLLALEMRLGEGSGAAVAALLLKAAIATHNGMATFAEAGVSDRR